MFAIMQSSGRTVKLALPKRLCQPGPGQFPPLLGLFDDRLSDQDARFTL
jgi:hypothetical protein